MPFDTSNLPFGGGILVAVAMYVLTALFVTGPVIGERVIEKSQWGSLCRADLKASIIDSEPAPTFTPKFDCNSILGWFPDGAQVCNQHGNPSFKIPGMDQLEEQQERVRDLNRRRLEIAVSDVGSSCDCAVSLTLERQRASFAIYAGSARLITPTPIKNLPSELKTALRSPLCAAVK